jgi:hypothetical protein
MLQGHSEAHLTVTVEHKDGRLTYHNWRGIRRLKSAKTRIRAHYETESPGCNVRFGVALWTNHYGAH